MKKIFVILFLCLICNFINAQSNTIYGSGINYTNGVPTGTVTKTTYAQVAIDTATKLIYRWNNLTSSWNRLGFGVDTIQSTGSPSYTPTGTRSPIVINADYEMYIYDSGMWNQIAGGGGGSDTQDLTATAGKGTLRLVNGGYVILNDSSATNEIQTIDTFEIVSNILMLSLLNDDEAYKQVDLSPYLDNTDAQAITITAGNGTIRLDDGGSVVLADSTTSNEGVLTLNTESSSLYSVISNSLGSATIYFKEGTGIDITRSGDTLSINSSVSDTDDQTLSWNGSTGEITISEGNTIDIDGRYLQSEVDGSTTNEAFTIDADDSDTEVISNQTLKFEGAGIISTDYVPGTDKLIITGTEVDGSTSNEIQSLTATAGKGTLRLDLGGGSVVLNDSSATNEIQTISILAGGGTINLSQSGGSITLNDSSRTNEIQYPDTFFIAGNYLKFSLINDGRLLDSVSLASYLDNTDAQTLDVFSTSGNTISASLSGDGEATKTASIINSNTLSISGNVITGAVNSQSDTVLVVGTHIVNLSGNQITSNTNGVTDTTLVIGNVTSSLSGSVLTTTVNGVSDTEDLSGLLTGSTTNVITQNGNTLTSTVNGVIDTTLTVRSVSNTSSTNSISTTVNGVTGSTVNIINSNSNSINGNTFTGSVNGVSDTSLIIGTHLVSISGNSITSNTNGITDTVLVIATNVLAIGSNLLTSTINGQASNSVSLAAYLDNTDSQSFSGSDDGTTFTLDLSGAATDISFKEGSGITITRSGTELTFSGGGTSDGNGIYSGDGTVPDGTYAHVGTSMANPDFFALGHFEDFTTVSFDAHERGLLLDDGGYTYLMGADSATSSLSYIRLKDWMALYTSNVANTEYAYLQLEKSSSGLTVDNGSNSSELNIQPDSARIVSDKFRVNADSLLFKIGGSHGTNGQVLTSNGYSATWQNASGGYTDEQAQDAVGAMVNSSLTYTDATPLLAIASRDFGDWTTSSNGTVATIDNGVISTAKLADSSVTTVKLISNSVGTTALATNSVTNAKINDVAWSKITGTPTTLSGYGITDALSNSTTSTQDGYFGDIYLKDDTSPSHYLQITNAENLTGSNKTLSIVTGNSNRTLTFSGDATISGTNTGDQTITLTGDVTGSGTGSFAATIADNSVDGTDIAFGSDAQGDVYYYDGTNVVRLPAGTSGYFLKTNGAGANPEWAAGGGGSDGNGIYSGSGTVPDNTYSHVGTSIANATDYFLGHFEDQPTISFDAHERGFALDNAGYTYLFGADSVNSVYSYTRLKDAIYSKVSNTAGTIKSEIDEQKNYLELKSTVSGEITSARLNGDSIYILSDQFRVNADTVTFKINGSHGTNGQVLASDGYLTKWTTVATLSDGDKGDITLSSSATQWDVDADAITANEIAAGAVGTSEIATNAVANADFRQSAGYSVVGRASSSTGDVADITAGADLDVLYRDGSTLVWGKLYGASIQTNEVSLTKLQQLSANTVLGNATGASGNVSEISLSASNLLGRGSSGNIAAITAGQGIAFTGTVLSGGVYAGSGNISDNTKAQVLRTNDFAIGYFQDYPTSVNDEDRGIWMDDEVYIYANDSTSGDFSRMYSDNGSWTTKSSNGSTESYVQNSKNYTQTYTSDGTDQSLFKVGSDSIYTYSDRYRFEVDSFKMVLSGSAGTNGQVLKSNGSVLYWASDDTGGGGVSDGDKGEITVTSSGTVWTIDNSTITSAKITDGTIVSGDVNDDHIILQGGNTIGETVVVGSNDANAFSIESNNVVRATVTGGASTGGAWTLTDVTSKTNTIEDVLTISANSTGTAAANYGTGILFNGESSTTDNQEMARVRTYWTTATHANREAALSVMLGDNAGSLGEVLKLDRVGDSNGELTIGASSTVKLNSTILTPSGNFTILPNSGTGILALSATTYISEQSSSPSTPSSGYSVIYPKTDGAFYVKSDGALETNIAGTIIAPSQITSDQDDYSPTGFTAARLIYVSSDNGMRAITSFPLGLNGEEKTFINTGTYPLYFPADHPDGSTNNKIKFTEDIILMPKRSITFVAEAGNNNYWHPINYYPPYSGKIVEMSFVPGAAASSDYGVQTVGTSGSGSGSTSTAATSTIPLGNYSLSTGTTATGGANLYTAKTLGSHMYFGSSHITISSLIYIPTLSNGTDSFTVFSQITGTPSSPGFTWAHSAGIMYSHGLNGGNWTGYTTDVSTTNKVNLNVAVAANTSYLLRTEIDKSRSEVRWYINDVYVGRSTSNIPAAGTCGYSCGIKKGVGTSARTVSVANSYIRSVTP